MLEDSAAIASIALALIGADTRLSTFKRDLRSNEAYDRLAKGFHTRRRYGFARGYWLTRHVESNARRQRCPGHSRERSPPSPERRQE